MFFLLTFIAVTSAAFADYTPDTYPDSLRNPGLCGLDEPGYLCDPNGVLKKENRTLTMLHKLVDVQSKTKCVCEDLADRTNGRCDGSGLGYIMSIALTQSMVLNDDEKTKDRTTQAAQVFADKIRVRQARGHCQDDLLIFLSVDDQVVWTSVGEATNRYLSSEMITSISTHAEEFFFKKSKYYDGLNFMLDTYLQVLNGQKVKVVEHKAWYYPLPLWAIILIFVVVGIILLAVVGISIYCCVKHCCCNDGRGRYAMASSNTRM